MNPEKMKEIILEVTGEMNKVAHDDRLPEDLHYQIEKLSTQLTAGLRYLRPSIESKEIRAVSK